MKMGAYLVGGELEISPRATAFRVTFLVITTEAPSKGKILPPTRYAPPAGLMLLT